MVGGRPESTQNRAKNRPEKETKKTQEPEEAARRELVWGSKAALQKEVVLVQGGPIRFGFQTTEKQKK